MGQPIIVRWESATFPESSKSLAHCWEWSVSRCVESIAHLTMENEPSIQDLRLDVGKVKGRTVVFGSSAPSYGAWKIPNFSQSESTKPQGASRSTVLQLVHNANSLPPPKAISS